MAFHAPQLSALLGQWMLQWEGGTSMLGELAEGRQSSDEGEGSRKIMLKLAVKSRVACAGS